MNPRTALNSLYEATKMLKLTVAEHEQVKSMAMTIDEALLKLEELSKPIVVEKLDTKVASKK